MYRIIEKKELAPLIFYMEVEAPRVAGNALPGQFVIVRATDEGERIPLTICDMDPAAGRISLVIQIVGVSTNKICGLNVGDSFSDVVGPLGRPSEMVDLGAEQLHALRYLFIAGGVGAAPVFPQAKYLYDKGVRVDIILGARTSDMIILESELSKVCDHLYICTDDGSRGIKGNVTVAIERVMSEGRHYTRAVAIGPLIMMKFASLTTQKYNLPTTVSINSLMVDGTGMCGACRVKVGGKIKFACVEGPEFEASEVDFDDAISRSRIYSNFERKANARAGLDFLLKNK